jgi:hypothetical protein
MRLRAITAEAELAALKVRATNLQLQKERMQPAFALWMMGFPEDWCNLSRMEECRPQGGGQRNSAACRRRRPCAPSGRLMLRGRSIFVLGRVVGPAVLRTAAR